MFLTSNAFDFRKIIVRKNRLGKTRKKANRKSEEELVWKMREYRFLS